MRQGHNYIATWFYRESHEEASFYPQAGGRGDSELLHSVYMQIQVPFFTTFRHYNPQARMIFFTNLTAGELPPFLLELFGRAQTEVVTVPFLCKPPKGWYKAWMNQHYLYDILREMEKRMQPEDTVLVCDADCLCRKPLDNLFDSARKNGCTLYELGYPRGYVINGTTIEDMEAVYTGLYGIAPSTPMKYYGGELFVMRKDIISRINSELPQLRAYNFNLPERTPRLHEEAHMLSVLAERLQIRNAEANAYVKRMWTIRQYNNVVPGDEQLAVWHLPSEKKFGLYRLYRLLEKDKGIPDENSFWKKAGAWCGVPRTGLKKKLTDFCLRMQAKLKP